jgi:hypothetical protein
VQRAGEASEHKAQKVHRLLSAAVNRAVRYGWLAANPCVQATKPKVTAAEIEPPPPEWVRSTPVSPGTLMVATAYDTAADMASR